MFPFDDVIMIGKHSGDAYETQTNKHTKANDMYLDSSNYVYFCVDILNK